jgi:hypothetical protein
MCRLRVLENKVQKRIFGPKRNEETEEWWKLHNEELHNPNFLNDLVKEDEMGGACSMNGRGGGGGGGGGRRRRRRRRTHVGYLWESQKELHH